MDLNSSNCASILYNISLESPELDFDESLIEHASRLWRSEWFEVNDLCGEFKKFSSGKKMYIWAIEILIFQVSIGDGSIDVLF